ncbi:hypothetical protein D8O27_13970 [Burkholderia mallei]|uniref:Uncharacterized protein n=1 Tax=Burkholderia mallei TaxID=13373 RepID=A0AAX1XBV0_BURML|nr:hypothetical protein BMASAVP1_0134 [Burkholderia mallei SAVP1]PNX06651.1 hypothetical protein CF649_00315 [Burkholderia sp. 136(2017)]PNX15478.1 hypothetical protein CF650_13035 [Burkholderia sp. 129]PNX33890.1 hypothetical protein CF647_00225 [Burkholderia sp. 117]PNX42372.1 hypothetical protein CF648_00315 [Burkholderia sp. 137]RKO01217.1 hypothetical protein D8O31_05615 [Burkholderia mallei]
MIGGSGFGRGGERTILCNDAREGNDRFVLWLWDGRKCAGRTSKDARRESDAAGAGARRAGGFAGVDADADIGGNPRSSPCRLDRNRAIANKLQRNAK